MRVLHVYRTYYPDPPGGLQEAIRQIALATQMHGVENRIYCLSTAPQPKQITREEGLVCRTRSWMAPASCDIGFLDSFRLFKTQTDWADLVHYHFPWPFADVLHLTQQHTKPSVMTYHSDVVGKGLLGKLYKPLQHKMLTSMDAVVATSPAYIKSSPSLNSGLDPDRLRVIPLGIGETTYREYFSAAESIDLSSRYSLMPDEYFLFIGVLRPYKGLEYLLEAAKSTKLPVVIAGDGYLWDQITQQASNNKNIHLLGQVSHSEKIALIKGCRALVLPSHLRSEAFGMVLVEAAMCGKPLISCEIGTGTTFVNKRDVTGLVVNPRMPDELATAMNTLSDDQKLSAHMGEAARARYEQKFSGEALGNAYFQLYKEFV
jgi:glycosyltransferase involved in cell wall biosynthesis